MEAGRLLIMLCARSRAVIEEWAELALSEPGLFTDDASALPNHHDFVEHRHDQAIFSALMWRSHISASEEWECCRATRLRGEQDCCPYGACEHSWCECYRNADLHSQSVRRLEVR